MPRALSPALLACALALVVAAPARAEVVPGEVVVRFDADATAAQRTEARAAVDGTVLETVAPRTQVVAVDGGVAAAVDALQDADGVRWAEPNAVVHAAWTPNDPAFGSQWALSNGAAPGVDINAPGAWDLQRGSASVLLGVVDTGTQADHPDLGPWWANPGELAGNGIDDDGNGYVDDVRGYDFVNADGDPADDHQHGTAVAGTAAARTDNALGAAGVAGGTTIITAKVLNSAGSGTTAAVAAGMRYVAEQGARVVNLSLGGGGGLPQVEADAAAAHPETLFVVAAGNEGVDNDSQPHYPCALPQPNILCVGASDSTDAAASFSNWGHTTVDVMAPGVSVLAAKLNGTLAWWDGTSFAAPVTAGVAALLAAADPTATTAQLKQAILEGGDAVAGFAALTVSGRRVDALGALHALAAPGTPVTPAPSAAAVPALSGTARQGMTLTATTGSWNDAAGATYAYQWQRCNALGAGCVTLGGATGAAYVLALGDVGQTVRVRVTATTTAGSAASTSAASALVAPALRAPVAVTAPSVAGTARAGATLTASAGAWDANPVATVGAIQWQRCSPGCADLEGATGPTRVAAAADVGATLRVRVTATNSAGAATAVSAATAPVAAAVDAPAPAPAPAVAAPALTPEVTTLRTPAVAHAAAIATRRATLGASGRFGLRVSCPAGTACRGTLVVTSAAGHHAVLGRRTFALAAGTSATLSLRPTATARALLRRARVVRAVATLTLADGTSASATLQLRRA